MPTITEHADGMPCWIDASVSTSAEREGLIQFYSSLFGWTFDVDAPETGYYSIARHDGKAVLGIGEQPDGRGTWVTYFSTSDIEGTAERVKANGGQVFFPPMQVMDVGWMALAMDPTGAVHGLWQPISFSGFEVVYEPNAPGWFDHISEDMKSAGKYYEGVLANGIESDAQDCGGDARSRKCDNNFSRSRCWKFHNGDGGGKEFNLKFGSIFRER